ncbi:hypothetical protein JCGZ_01920 [Jatropha curcas]|uniref:Aminotransferase-like plant mobile domain-containing protein n=1 Tax=Jatropha curcas TaxID=180498 RepID=A0A067JTP9_JATCU|nr:hypothetical protein JCGZ_01920 [Jatropha curcas]
MTPSPADFTVITGLGFDGDAVPLDSRYQTAALGAELVGTLLGVPTRTRYTAQGYVSYEVVYKFWAERIRTRLAAWRELPVDARPAAPAYTREERDQAARSFIFYIISSQLLCTSQNKGDPAVLACLRDLSLIGSYDSASLALAHLYHGSFSARLRALADLLLTPWEGDAWVAYPPRALTEALIRSRVLLQGYWVDRYFLGESVLEIHTAMAQKRVPVATPRHMCVLDGMTPEDRLLEYDGFPADDYLIPGDYASYLATRLRTRLLDVREYSQERRRHRTPAFYEAQAEVDAPTESAGAAQSYQELYQRFCFARSYIARLYPEHHDMELEIGRLRRHQSHQAAVVSRLQMEVDKLRTRLEVEGIPLDFSEEEDDDDDGSSSDDAPPPPPSSVRQAAAGPSRRRR